MVQYEFKGTRKTIYFGGDSGYGPHFKTIGKLFPTIDYCLLPIGAYMPEFIMKDVHQNPEEAIQAFVQNEDDEVVLAVVTAVPDAKKGDRSVVVHLQLEKTPQEICDHLKQLGMPNLWIPSQDSFLQVEAIPLLGTGKLDLRALRQLACDHFDAAQ